MILSPYLSLFFVIFSVGTSKTTDGDDDWVHLPNKCEGNGGSDHVTDVTSCFANEDMSLLSDCVEAQRTNSTVNINQVHINKLYQVIIMHQ